MSKVDAFEVFHKINMMVAEYGQEYNKWPRYVFMSQGAINAIIKHPGVPYGLTYRDDPEIVYPYKSEKFMGIEVKIIDVPGVYASIGGDF